MNNEGKVNLDGKNTQTNKSGIQTENKWHSTEKDIYVRRKENK